MGNKPRSEKPMVPINLHVSSEVSVLAEKIARERKISRAQVIRGWIDKGREKSGTEPVQ